MRIHLVVIDLMGVDLVAIDLVRIDLEVLWTSQQQPNLAKPDLIFYRSNAFSVHFGTRLGIGY